ncbi:MAG: hypothetical protein UR22_C0020G0013 [Parcubacteria group bacterium GW2011_GWC2_32_10]|nr:MAG: hypothetical protein UR22_C0020G0013 [Parcubacteria group bacterium GW2011_GWC2_32_10]
MYINQIFFDKIEPVLVELKNKLKTDFVLFGSAPLYLMGVLEFNKDSVLNDLDIALRDLSCISQDAKEVQFRKDPNQKLYKINIQGINVDMGSAWPGQEEIFEKIFKNPVIERGFKFANLDICLEWRELIVKKYGREKDIIYLEKIKQFRLKNNYDRL